MLNESYSYSPTFETLIIDLEWLLFCKKCIFKNLVTVLPFGHEPQQIPLSGSGSSGSGHVSGGHCNPLHCTLATVI